MIFGPRQFSIRNPQKAAKDGVFAQCIAGSGNPQGNQSEDETGEEKQRHRPGMRSQPLPAFEQENRQGINAMTLKT